MNTETELQIASPTRLNRTDMRAAVAALTPAECRYLIDRYYQIQDDRKRSGNQVRAAIAAGEPNALLEMVNSFETVVESQIKSAMGLYAASFPAGQWAQAQDGIGPVISAALQAYIDMSRCPSPSALWRFAGLDPTSKWHSAADAKALCGEGLGALNAEQIAEIATRAGLRAETIYQRHAFITKAPVEYGGDLPRAAVTKALSMRPYSAAMKQVAYHIGSCIIRVRGVKPDAFYGVWYDKFKLREIQKNENGEFAEQAKAGLNRVGAATESAKHYREGKLPPGHIDARARRWIAKLFLSHYWEVRYRAEFGREPPRPWIIEKGGHADFIMPPRP